MRTRFRWAGAVAGAAALAVALATTLTLTPSASAETTWSAPVDLSTPGRNAYQSQVAMSADGRTRAYVWQQDTGSNRLIKTTFTVDGGVTWASRDLSAAGTNSFMPRVAVSSDGSTLVYAWGNRTTGNAEAAFSLDRGANWTVMSLGRSVTEWEDPWTAVSDDGRTIAFLWTYYDGTNRFARVTHTHDAGTSWTTKDLTHPSSGNVICNPEVETPRLAISGDGMTLAAAWNCRDNVGTQGLHSIDGGLTWTSNWVNGRLPDTWPSGRGGGIPSVAVGGSGASATIAYAYLATDASDASKAVIGTVISADNGSTWADRKLSGVGAAYPGVAVSRDGSTLAYVWTLNPNRVQAVISRDRGATGLTSPRDLGSGIAVGARVGVSRDGSTVAYTWRGSDGTTTRSQGVVSTDGGSTGLEAIMMLSAAGANVSTNEQVAVSGDGTVVAFAWERDSGAGNVVQTTYSPSSGPSPDPGPPPSPGPAPEPTPTQSPTQSPTPAPSIEPTPAPTPEERVEPVVNGPTPLWVGGRVVVVDAPTAAVTPARYLKKPAATRLRTAPQVTAKVGRPTALVVAVGTPGTDVTLTVKVGSSYRPVGIVRSDAGGRVVLPVMRFDAAGTYTIALVAPTGTARYVKVVVA